MVTFQTFDGDVIYSKVKKFNPDGGHPSRIYMQTFRDMTTENNVTQYVTQHTYVTKLLRGMTTENNVTQYIHT